MQNPHFVNLKDPLGNIISGPFNTIPGNSDIIQLNHYYTRSMEDSYEKQNRGRTDCLQSYEIPHLHELDNNIKDDEEDNLALIKTGKKHLYFLI